MMMRKVWSSWASRQRCLAKAVFGPMISMYSSKLGSQSLHSFVSHGSNDSLCSDCHQFEGRCHLYQPYIDQILALSMVHSLTCILPKVGLG